MTQNFELKSVICDTLFDCENEIHISYFLKFFNVVPHVPPGLEGPSITGSVSRYYVGNTVNVNCSSARSLEPAQLQWYVNDQEVCTSML